MAVDFVAELYRMEGAEHLVRHQDFEYVISLICGPINNGRSV